MRQEIKNGFTSLTTGGVLAAIFGIFQGRCTFAAIGFSGIGIYGWLHGKDLTSFSIFVASIQALLVLHSWKSDIHEQRTARLEMDRARGRVVSDLENANVQSNGT